ncbi:MAG: hypothetical protein ACKOCK_01960 [Chloroflexota bacterium]
MNRWRHLSGTAVGAANNGSGNQTQHGTYGCSPIDGPGQASRDVIDSVLVHSLPP